MKMVWDESAWDDYVWWQTQDRKVLKHGFHGYWSRRITDEHRLVYKISEDELLIAACRYHYGT